MTMTDTEIQADSVKARVTRSKQFLNRRHLVLHCVSMGSQMVAVQELREPTFRNGTDLIQRKVQQRVGSCPI